MKEKQAISIVKSEINVLRSCSDVDEFYHHFDFIRGMIEAFYKIKRLTVDEAIYLLDLTLDVRDEFRKKFHSITNPVDYSLIELPF